jgi:hypothetical protein
MNRWVFGRRSDLCYPFKGFTVERIACKKELAIMERYAGKERRDQNEGPRRLALFVS